jgi:hypothetical protein
MYYKGFVDFIVKYEDINQKKATAGDVFTVQLMSGDNKIDMKEQLTKMAESIKNPFLQVSYWLKGEIMELYALLEAISRKEGIES